MSSPRQKLNHPINNANCIMPLAKIKWRCNSSDKYQALKMCRIYEIQDFIVKFPQLSTPLRSSFNFVMLVSQRGWISRRVVCFCHFYRRKKRDTWVGKIDKRNPRVTKWKRYQWNYRGFPYQKNWMRLVVKIALWAQSYEDFMTNKSRNNSIFHRVPSSSVSLLNLSRKFCDLLLN